MAREKARREEDGRCRHTVAEAGHSLRRPVEELIAVPGEAGDIGLQHVLLVVAPEVDPGIRDGLLEDVGVSAEVSASRVRTVGRRELAERSPRPARVPLPAGCPRGAFGAGCPLRAAVARGGAGGRRGHVVGRCDSD